MPYSLHTVTISLERYEDTLGTIALKRGILFGQQGLPSRKLYKVFDWHNVSDDIPLGNTVPNGGLEMSHKIFFRVLLFCTAITCIYGSSTSTLEIIR